MNKFRFGLEHEVAFLKGESFADLYNTSFNEFEEIIDKLPTFNSDYSSLRIDDFLILKNKKIKVKRWYIEGYERLNNNGSINEFVPKGIEIRTTRKDSIKAAVAELRQSFQSLKKVANLFGFSPVLISYNPFNYDLVLKPPLNKYELDRLKIKPEEKTGYLTIYTFAPDLNISVDGMSDQQLVDIAQKLTYYSPFIIPFSFSAPFYKGKLWNGYSIRTYIRTGKNQRYAVRVFVQDKKYLIAGNPLISLIRSQSEKFRIEFKAFDSCGDFRIYAGLLALLKGLVLDKTLTGRALVPDKKLHQLSSRKGFDDKQIRDCANEVLFAAKRALNGDQDMIYLELLEEMLRKKFMPAQSIIDEYKFSRDVISTLKKSYIKLKI